MAIRPPFELIPQLAAMQERRPSPATALAQGAVDITQGFVDERAKRQAATQEALKTLLTQFSLRPAPVAGEGGVVPPAQGAPASTIFSGLTGGRRGAQLPAEFAGLQAVPKTDINELARILPAILQLQKPGVETSVSGLVEPGAVPGLKPGATVSPKKPSEGAGRGPSLQSLLGQSDTAARAAISDRIRSAMADPASANVKNYPILDSKVAKQEYIKEFRQKATIRKVPEKDINDAVKTLESSFSTEETAFQGHLSKGLDLVKSGKASKEEIKRRLMEKYPLFRGDIVGAKELK